MFHTVQLSKQDPTPLYIQLATELAKLIRAGLLKEGTKLPAIRLLSNQLAINRDTVVSAYKLLENQGLVEGHIGKGTYVLPLPAENLLAAPSIQNQICCSQLCFPKTLFNKSLCMDLASQVVNAEGWNAFSDPLYRERLLLKQSISNFFKNIHIDVPFARVRLIQQLDQFYLSLFKYFSKTGICVETPRNLTLSCYLRSMGAKIYEIPLLEDGMDLNILEKALKTGNISYIFLSSCLQDPTGICYSKEKQLKILELAKTYDCYIVDDSSFCEFIVPQKKHYALFQLNIEQNRIIHLFHFSKLYMPYTNFCFAILPSALMRHLTDTSTCSFTERMLHYYLDSKALNDIRSSLISDCEKKYHFFLQELNYLSNNFSVYSTKGSLFFWIKPLTHSNKYICDLLTKNHIIVAPGDLFTSNTPSPYFRLSITQLSTKQIQLIFSLLHTI